MLKSLRFSWINLIIVWMITSPTIQASQNTIHLWHTQDGLQAKYLDALITAFENHYETPVELETGVDLLESLLIQHDTQSQMPDLILAPSDFIVLHNIIGYRPIPQYVSTQNIAADAMASFKTNDTPNIALPLLWGNHLLMFYNKSLVQTPIASLEQNLSDSVHPNKRKEINTPIAMHVESAYTFLSLYSNFISREEFRQLPVLNKHACTKAIDLMSRLFELGVPPTCGYDCVTTDFLNGNVPYAIHGEWMLAEAREKLGENLGVLPLPDYKGKPLHSLRGAQVLFIPEGAKTDNARRNEIRQHLILWMSRVQAAEGWYRTAGRVPTHTTVLEQIRKDQDMAPVLTALERSYDMPTHDDVQYLWSRVRKALQLYLVGTMTKPQTCDTLHTWLLNP